MHGDSLHDYELTGNETTEELVERKRYADQRAADREWMQRQMFERRQLSDGSYE